MEGKIGAEELVKLYLAGKTSFRNADLSGVNLERANLQGIDLQGAYLRWASLLGTNLRDANLSWADLQRANLSDAILQKANLKEASLRKAKLQWTDFQEAQLQSAKMEKCDLACANLRAASLRLASLQGANLDKANMLMVDLRVATLTEAKLLDANLEMAKLQEANLSKTNLMGANLAKASANGASFQEARLFGANLSDANLTGVNLTGADLQEAKLFGTNLSGANLTEARLPSLQNMQGAKLSGAQLKGVRLPRGENLPQAIPPDGVIPDRRSPRALEPVMTTAELLPEKAVPEMPPQEESAANRRGLTLYSFKAQVEVGAIHLSGAEGHRHPMEGDGQLGTAAIAIAHRRGPSLLRQQLLAAYNRRCAITGCDVEPLLEAVLLLPSKLVQNTHDASDGLLLRADIHTLFDLHLITIDPDTMKVIVAPSLRPTSYGEFDGQPLRHPVDRAFRPNHEGLQWRFNWCDWVHRL